MNYELILSNVFAWAMQAGLLIGLAAIVPALLRMKTPGLRLAHWQAVLPACLLLPLLHTWKQDFIMLATPTWMAIAKSGPPLPVAHKPAVSIPELLLGILAAGIAVNLVLLGLGFLRLRRYRLRSRPLGYWSPWSVEADLRLTDDIASPVTFGARRPVVLLPSRFPELDEAMREAILCHEVLHVRRHDWLFTAGEEIVRAVLWFHPAIWWLLGEIQLAREQTVDRAVVDMMQCRDQYVDALLTIAGAPPRLDLAPAPLFLRRRHLKQRVVSILMEARMSRARTVSTLAASLGLLAAWCWLVTTAIPLKAEPQIVADAAGVRVELDSALLLHRSPVNYPTELAARGVGGTVTLQVKLDANGAVSDASVVSGPEELRKYALQSVLDWHFTKDAALGTRQIAIDFEAPKPVAPALSAAAIPVAPAAPQVPAQTPEIIRRIVVIGLPDAQRDALLAQLPVHEGDTFDRRGTMRKVNEAAHAFDEHLRVSYSARAAGDDTELAIIIWTPDAVAPPPPLPPPPPWQLQAPAGALRIGANVAAANILTKVTPVYPPLAKAARVQGTVRFEVLIGKDGTIQNLRLVEGPPLLVQAAMEAVQQWVYRPTLLNGAPVEILTTIDINFTLAQ